MQWTPTPTLHATKAWSLLEQKMFPKKRTQNRSTKETTRERLKKLKLALTEWEDYFSVDKDVLIESPERAANGYFWQSKFRELLLCLWGGVTFEYVAFSPQPPCG